MFLFHCIGYHINNLWFKSQLFLKYSITAKEIEIRFIVGGNKKKKGDFSSTDPPKTWN